MDRSIWTREITKSYCPPWPCPVCKKGTTAIVKDSLVSKETVQSIRSHSHEDFDFEWVEYVFTAWAKCTQSSCGQLFAISGTGGVAPQFISDDDWDYEDCFIPKACHPMPEIIELPKNCPNDVAYELKAAFSLFWTEKAGCANRIRVSLEHLMNHLGIPKKRKNSIGKFSELSLHARIEAFAKKKPVVGQHLMALKWLGNTGSHDGSVSTRDLLDAFEIIEYSFREIIDDHSAKLASLAKSLTKKHSPK